MSVVAGREKKIFIGVLVLLCLSIVYRLMNPFTQETVSELTYDGKKEKTPHDQTSATSDHENDTGAFTVNAHGRMQYRSPPNMKTGSVFTEKCESEADHLPEGGRDLFYKKVMPLPTLVATSDETTEDGSRVSEAEKEALMAQQAAEMAEREKKERLSSIVESLSSLRILGACKKGEGLSFFIKDGDTVQVVTKGDRVKGSYPITQMTQDFLLIHIPEFNETVKINLKDFNDDKYL